MYDEPCTQPAVFAKNHAQHNTSEWHRDLIELSIQPYEVHTLLNVQDTYSLAAEVRSRMYYEILFHMFSFHVSRQQNCWRCNEYILNRRVDDTWLCAGESMCGNEGEWAK